MKIFLSYDVVCPTNNRTPTPMHIWCVEIDWSHTETPMAYVYLQCSCHESVIQVDIPLNLVEPEHWIYQKDIDVVNEIRKRKVRGMPPLDGDDEA